MVSGKRKVTRYVLLGIALPLLFAASGWLFLSKVEGWLGVFLWIIFSVPVCFLVEFLMRPQTNLRRSAKSLPRMKVRTPMRGDPERSVASGRSRDADFPWHRDDRGRRRRRSYAR